MIWNIIVTLDDAMVQKLAVHGLRRGIECMDYIHTLLIMEDDLQEDDMGEFGIETQDIRSSNQNTTGQPAEPNHLLLASLPDWCLCEHCRPM